MDIEEILALWREAGGDTHGPNIETATIPLDRLPEFVAVVRESRRTLIEPAKVGNTVFRAGVSERTVVERAQREFVAHGYEPPHWPGVKPSLAQRERLPEGAIEWLANGNRGISSDTIFTHLSGYDALGSWGPDYPHDVGDFLRCEALLNAVPEFRARMNEMADSPVWAQLVENWQEIAEMIAEERPTGRCPDAYNAIKECIRAGGGQ